MPGIPKREAASWREQALAQAVSRSQVSRAGERGNIGMMFGLAVIPFTLFVGAGVDIGRWLHAREETISAMDAAVLAGARARSSSTPPIMSGADQRRRELLCPRTPRTA